MRFSRIIRRTPRPPNSSSRSIQPQSPTIGTPSPGAAAGCP